jgi:hypothetical protein
LRAFVNGELLCTVVDTSTEAFSSGTIGVGAANATGWWDDVNVTIAQSRLDVTKSGNGAGTVTSMPEGIDCGITCTADFDKGTVVTLTATADPASYFVGWDGAGCSGTDPCVVTLTTAQSVTATFSTYNVFLPIALKEMSTTLRLYRVWP